MKKEYVKIAVDLLLYLLVLAPLLVSLAGLLQFDRGKFHCSDPSIRMQRRPDTVSTKLLVAVLFVPIIFIVFITELLSGPKTVLKTALKRAGKNTASIYVRYFFASTINIAVNDILKSLSAVPRPHFIETCQPDWSRINCTENAGYVDFRRDLCLSENTKAIHDSMKSFPSGHAQLMAFMAMFIAVYFEKRVGDDFSKVMLFWHTVWKKVLQLVLLILPVYSGTSRLEDQRHHVADVWVGAAIGVVMAILSTKDMFNEPEVKTPTTNRRECVENENRKEKQKRPSKIRLLSDFGFGTMAENDREMREVNPAC